MRVTAAAVRRESDIPSSQARGLLMRYPLLITLLEVLGALFALGIGFIVFSLRRAPLGAR
jgi:hypothetical protein